VQQNSGAPRANPVFVTGATGYVGRPLVEALVARGCEVHALARPGSESRVPQGALVVSGDALDASTYRHRVPVGASFVHLVGTPRPSPAKAGEFRRVDLVSIRAAVDAAVHAGVRHFVYVSVAQPAPIMAAYIAVRQEGEAAVRASGLRATVLRPWYVLGPGHYWPYALLPFYAILRRLPNTRAAAERLGLVTHRQFLAALILALEEPPGAGVRVLGVPEIRRAGFPRSGGRVLVP
jgi:uncharacterized protein YbjT (DUF2867 family)